MKHLLVGFVTNDCRIIATFAQRIKKQKRVIIISNLINSYINVTLNDPINTWIP